MSISEYARHRAVRHHAVQRAIKDGRITTTADGKIDPVEADAQWDKNTNARKSRAKVAKTKRDALTIAQTRRELASAEIREMELARLRGDLISASEVRASTFNLARTTRDRLLGIPDRIAALLASESNPAKCHEILTGEIRAAIEAIAKAAAS